MHSTLWQSGTLSCGNHAGKPIDKPCKINGSCPALFRDGRTEKYSRLDQQDRYNPPHQKTAQTTVFLPANSICTSILIE